MGYINIARPVGKVLMARGSKNEVTAALRSRIAAMRLSPFISSPYDAQYARQAMLPGNVYCTVEGVSGCYPLVPEWGWGNEWSRTRYRRYDGALVPAQVWEAPIPPQLEWIAAFTGLPSRDLKIGVCIAYHRDGPRVALFIRDNRAAPEGGVWLPDAENALANADSVDAATEYRADGNDHDGITVSAAEWSEVMSWNSFRQQYLSNEQMQSLVKSLATTNVLSA